MNRHKPRVENLQGKNIRIFLIHDFINKGIKLASVENILDFSDACCR